MDNKEVLNEEQQAELEVAQREAMEKKTEFQREMSCLVLLTVFTLAILGMSLSLWMPGFEMNSPGMYPGLASMGMLLCCVIAIGQLIAKRKNMEKWEEEGAWNRLKLCLITEVPFVVFVMIVASILYAVAMGLIGFYISTFVYLAFSIFFLFKGEKKKLVQSLLVSAGMIVAVYLIIELLFQIKMP